MQLVVSGARNKYEFCAIHSRTLASAEFESGLHR